VKSEVTECRSFASFFLTPYLPVSGGAQLAVG
jgi:hypothetical protein